jgi:hypothetical protein
MCSDFRAAGRSVGGANEIRLNTTSDPQKRRLNNDRTDRDPVLALHLLEIPAQFA